MVQWRISPQVPVSSHSDLFTIYQAQHTHSWLGVFNFLELIVPLVNMFFVQVSTWLTHSLASNICSRITFSAGSSPLQYSYLGNPVNRSSLVGCVVHGVAKVRHDHRRDHHRLLSKVYPDQSIKTETIGHLPLHTDTLSPFLALYFSWHLLFIVLIICLCSLGCKFYKATFSVCAVYWYILHTKGSHTWHRGDTWKIFTDWTSSEMKCTRHIAWYTVSTYLMIVFKGVSLALILI